jgi:hypothetical protein
MPHRAVPVILKVTVPGTGLHQRRSLPDLGVSQAGIIGGRAELNLLFHRFDRTLSKMMLFSSI